MDKAEKEQSPLVGSDQDEQEAPKAIKSGGGDFDPLGIHRKTHTQFDPDGFDVYGYDQEGYDREGLRLHGV